jgi:hypothetical protein
MLYLQSRVYFLGHRRLRTAASELGQMHVTLSSMNQAVCDWLLDAVQIGE